MLTKAPSLDLPSILPVGVQRALSIRNSGVTNGPTVFTPSNLVVAVICTPQKFPRFNTWDRNTSYPRYPTHHYERQRQKDRSPSHRNQRQGRTFLRGPKRFSRHISIIVSVTYKYVHSVESPSYITFQVWLQLSRPLNCLSFCDTLHPTYSSCRTRHCRACTSISLCTLMLWRPEPH